METHVVRKPDKSYKLPAFVYSTDLICGPSLSKKMKRTILITGSSTGIGRATAKYFHAKGWNVVATMRDPGKEKELQALDHVLVSRLDVLDLASIDAAVASGIERFGQIDVLVNNAGYGAYGPLESFPREKVLRQFHTNVIGLLDVTRAMLPHFRSHGAGVIINISSMGGRMTFPLGSLYHGTKFAVEGISESLRYEVEQFGGKVKVVEPGAIATDFAGRSFDFHQDDSMAEYKDIVQKALSVIPRMMEKASSVDVVTNVIYRAATDGSSRLRYVAGTDAKIYQIMNRLLGYPFIRNMNKRFFKL
jgi:NAD(P)-dependent dehydrogenase (short-subunit alcohol dehydrogenase family)